MWRYWVEATAKIYVVWEIQFLHVAKGACDLKLERKITAQGVLIALSLKFKQE
jgi:hypothetical protein